jgi:hypothetical protein
MSLDFGSRHAQLLDSAADPFSFAIASFARPGRSSSRLGRSAPRVEDISRRPPEFGSS